MIRDGGSIIFHIWKFMILVEGPAKVKMTGRIMSMLFGQVGW